jgi:hypothetical protein
VISVPPFHSLQSASEAEAAVQRTESRMILIVGADVRGSDEAAVTLFRAGHIPLMPEWFAFPLSAVGWSLPEGHSAVRDVLPPIADRLLDRCDAVLHMNHPEADAAAIVGLARARGLRVYATLAEALEG